MFLFSIVFSKIKKKNIRGHLLEKVGVKLNTNLILKCDLRLICGENEKSVLLVNNILLKILLILIDFNIHVVN